MNGEEICCGCCGVNRAVTVSAIISLLFGLLEVIGFWTGIGAAAVISSVFTVLCSGCLWFGVKKERPAYYWPFMIWNFIRILGSTIAITMLSLGLVGFASGMELKDGSGYTLTDQDKAKLKTFCLVGLVIYAISLILSTWSQYAVLTGYGSMKRQVNESVKCQVQHC